MRWLPLAVAALPLLAATADARDRDPLAGRAAGTPRQCVPQTELGTQQVLDARTIVFSRTDRLWWVVHPDGPCPGLGSTLATLVVERDGSQLCRNDRFVVRQPNQLIPAAPCRFGAFTPYTLPERR